VAEAVPGLPNKHETLNSNPVLRRGEKKEQKCSSFDSLLHNLRENNLITKS
jgi:hypothetical protein